MLVSIVIPAYNAAQTLEACLRACLGQTYPETEVVVVDDGSTDATPGIAVRLGIRCLRQPNRGPAAARNAGARVAAGEIIAYTDADCVPERSWIAELVAGFAPGVVAVGGTYGIANPERLLARLVHEEIMVRHGRFGGEVDFLGSFNVAYLKEAFHAVGGFDERFRTASGEDNDLAYRLQDAGGRLCFRKEAVVAHHHPVRLTAYLRAQMRHGLWRVFLYRLHPARARSGDRYARGPELLTPPVMLLLLLLAPVCAGAGAIAGSALVALLPLPFIGLLGLAHAPVAIQMWRRSGRLEMIGFPALALLRDAARATGLIIGLCWFIWNKGSS